MNYRKPVTFRPTVEDAGALELLSKKNPIIKANTVDLIRVALQDYWFNHAPNAGRSKTERIDRLERKMDLVLAHLGIEFSEVIE